MEIFQAEGHPISTQSLRRKVINPSRCLSATFCSLYLHGKRCDRKRIVANVEPMVRFELTTLRLQGGCSATELHRHEELPHH